MTDDNLPFALIIFFGFFFLLILLPLSYLYVVGTKQRITQAQRTRLARLYNYDIEHIRREEPLLMAHIHQLVPSIGILPTIQYVSSAGALPIDAAQMLVCSEVAAAPAQLGPIPVRPGAAPAQSSAAPARGVPAPTSARNAYAQGAPMQGAPVPGAPVPGAPVPGAPFGQRGARPAAPGAPTYYQRPNTPPTGNFQA